MGALFRFAGFLLFLTLLQRFSPLVLRFVEIFVSALRHLGWFSIPLLAMATGAILIRQLRVNAQAKL